MDEKKERINKTTGALMIITAVFFDLVEFVLALFVLGIIFNRIIVILKWFLFWFWFRMNDVPFTTSTKRAVTATITFIVGFIPFLGALPEFTLGIAATIAMVRAEDKLGVAIPTSKAALRRTARRKIAGARLQEQPA